nr:LOW QUALITY PROTEIN: protein phosphatase 1 regulatory subunit 35 [Pelodiscus sinensis]|eukprot:XP_025036228.1 LOW QUALITY PROTEIN: protein phosphatase 1 regulatory subunit 35 [Pelodiscus sinensis]
MGQQVRFLLASGLDDGAQSPEPPASSSPSVAAGVAPLPMGLGRCGAWTEMGFGALAGDPPPSSNLAAPELHSSLALGREVQAAAHEAFDAHRAAQDLLATSFVVRCNVEEKAATAMNIPREQQLYQGLVSLQVPAEEVLSCAIQEKLSLVQTQPEPRKEPDLEGPDLLMFYEPLELFAETPYLSVEGLPPLRLQPPPIRPPASTFQMFRQLQQWDA